MRPRTANCKNELLEMNTFWEEKSSKVGCPKVGQKPKVQKLYSFHNLIAWFCLWSGGMRHNCHSCSLDYDKYNVTIQ